MKNTKLAEKTVSEMKEWQLAIVVLCANIIFAALAVMAFCWCQMAEQVITVKEMLIRSIVCIAVIIAASCVSAAISTKEIGIEDE